MTGHKGTNHMKLTEAQRHAYGVMLRSPDGAARAGDGVRRLTVEAMARKKLVTVTKVMRDREARGRGGRTVRRAYCDWTAYLLPPMPETAQIEELDLVAGSAQNTLLPSQRRQAAAYAALTGALSAPTDSDYRPAAAYAEHLRHDDAALLRLWRESRHAQGVTLAADHPEDAYGPATDFWLLTDSSTGAELGRVTASSTVLAKLAANYLLNRRGDGYTLRRLGEKEIGYWVKDFRLHGRTLRLTAAPDGDHHVSELAGGRHVASGPTALEAMHAARAATAPEETP